MRQKLTMTPQVTVYADCQGTVEPALPKEHVVAMLLLHESHEVKMR